MRKWLSWLFWLVVSWGLAVSPVGATSCTVVINPLGLPIFSYGVPVEITIQNTGDTVIRQIEIQLPFQDEGVFIKHPQTVEGWQMSEAQFSAQYSGELGIGEQLAIGWNLDIFDTDGYEGSWGVEVDDLGEGGSAGCEGNVAAYSNSSIDLAAPSISSVAVSVLSTTSVRVSWTTNEAATSQVDYGTSSGSYSGNTLEATPKISHSLTLESLTAGGTYFVRSKSVDAGGNTGYSGEYSFTMPSPTQTITTETTITVTQTTQSAPKVIVERDVTPPSVSTDTLLKGIFTKAPMISGTAGDGKGVYKVDYSLDGGKNWLPVDELTGAGSKKVSWSFLPMELLDGNYDVKVRATDTSNNVGFSEAETMVIDRLPPRVGSAVLITGAMVVEPIDGVLYTLSGIQQRLFISTVGGVTKLDLIAKPFEMGADALVFPLSQNAETGLWSGEMVFLRPGRYVLSAHGVDGANNEVTHQTLTVAVLPKGRVFGEADRVGVGASVGVYVFNPNTHRYVLWDGKTFLQENPQQIGDEGSYTLMLPPGKYYLEVLEDGYKLLRTPIFTLDQHTPINTDFHLQPLPGVTLWGRRWVLPSFQTTSVPIVSQIFIEKEKQALAGKPVSSFILSTKNGVLYGADLVGQPTVLSFLTTWSPVASEQMDVLADISKNRGVKVVPIFEQETQSAVDLFMRRGGYDLPVFVDEDGDLGEGFDLGTAPIHWLLDSKGMIKDVHTGFLTSDGTRNALF